MTKTMTKTMTTTTTMIKTMTMTETAKKDAPQRKKDNLWKKNSVNSVGRTNWNAGGGLFDRAHRDKTFAEVSS